MTSTVPAPTLTRTPTLEWNLGTPDGPRIVTVEPADRNRVKVRLNGEFVRLPRVPNAYVTWQESELGWRAPDLIVVQMLTSDPQPLTMVFRDGVNVDDGVSLADWRLRQPKGADRFNLLFSDKSARHWALWSACLFCAPAARVAGQERTLSTVVAAICALLLGYGCGWAACASIDAFRRRPDWDWRKRTAGALGAVFGILVGVPAAVVVTLVNLGVRI